MTLIRKIIARAGDIQIWTKHAHNSSDDNNRLATKQNSCISFTSVAQLQGEQKQRDRESLKVVKLK